MIAEWVYVHGRRYGTSHEEIRRLWSKGYDILLMSILSGVPLKASYPDDLCGAPDHGEPEQRLRGRGTGP